MLTYKYVKRSLHNFQDFDSIMINGGRDVISDDYYFWLKKNKEYYTYAIQADWPGEMRVTIDNYKHGLEIGAPNLIPVLHVNYLQALGLLKVEAEQYIALGKMIGHIEEEEQIKRLPKQYTYHGLAKGRLINSTILNSIDSSTWLSGVRGRKTDVHGWASLTFGLKGKAETTMVRSACNKHKEFLEKVNLKVDDLVEGTYDALLKAPLVLYYMPLFKYLRIFSENFS